MGTGGRPRSGRALVRAYHRRGQQGRSQGSAQSHASKHRGAREINAGEPMKLMKPSSIALALTAAIAVAGAAMFAQEPTARGRGGPPPPPNPLGQPLLNPAGHI